MNFKKISLVLAVLFLLAVCSEVSAQTRIRFARNRTSASVSSTIGGNSSRTFVLGARYGQSLSATVSSRNGCVVFGNGATSTSYITRGGNNFLYLRNNCGRMTSFTLTVSINYGSD